MSRVSTPVLVVGLTLIVVVALLNVAALLPKEERTERLEAWYPSTAQLYNGPYPYAEANMLNDVRPEEPYGAVLSPQQQYWNAVERESALRSEAPFVDARRSPEFVTLASEPSAVQSPRVVPAPVLGLAQTPRILSRAVAPESKEDRMKDVIAHGPPLAFSSSEMQAGLHLLSSLDTETFPKPPETWSQLHRIQSVERARAARAATEEARKIIRSERTAVPPPLSAAATTKPAAAAKHAGHKAAAKASSDSNLPWALQGENGPGWHIRVAPGHALHATSAAAAAAAAAAGSKDSDEPVHFNFKGFGMDLAAKVTWQPGAAAWYSYTDSLSGNAAGATRSGLVTSLVTALAAAALSLMLM